MLDLKVQRPESMQLQLARQIRAKILNGDLPVGTRLPPASEWAKQLGASYVALHEALGILSGEGLVKRRQRRGTYVCSNSPVEKMTLGIYCAPSLWSAQYLGFYQTIQRSLTQKLGTQNGRVKFWMDGRAPDEQLRPLPELLHAVKSGEIQGLAVLMANREVIPWLRDFPVASSFLTSANLPNRIHFDSRQFLRLGLDRLKSLGCRNVGLIGAIPTGDSEDGATHLNTLFYEDFLEECREAGLEFHNEWMYAPHQHGEIGNPELFGYIEAKRMLAQSVRPDGLIVYPDVVALGAAKAMLETGAPRHPELVFHRNLKSRLAFPAINASWISIDEDQIADGLLLQITKQIRGEEPPAVVVPYEITDIAN